MVQPDPARAIRDAIEHLEAAIQPVREEMQRVQEDSSRKLAELQAQLNGHTAELARWIAALDRAEGRTPQAPAKRQRPPVLKISDDEIARALLQGAHPLSASEIRQALEIDPSASYAQVTRLLSGAVDRGAIARTGQRGATRYSAP